MPLRGTLKAGWPVPAAGVQHKDVGQSASCGVYTVERAFEWAYKHMNIIL